MKRSPKRQPSKAKSAISVSRHNIVVPDPDKILYPAAKFRRADVLNYYLRVARYLLPHFRHRPVTLKRYPDGIHGDVFYEKDAPGFTPAWVKTFPVPRREGGPDIRYVLINDRATLAWAASVDSLELHPFLHRIPHLDRPTHVVFDLDPGEGADIRQCAEVALLLRQLLAKLRLKTFPKISGSKGIQVYVPLNSAVVYAATQPFAHAIAELLERQHPDLVVSEMPKNLRRGKVFIDWSQNAGHKTTVGVYSLRAKRHRPYVSMPVRWEELERAVKSQQVEQLYFTADAALARLQKVGDLFAPVLKLKQKLPAEFEKLLATPTDEDSSLQGRPRRSRLQEYEAKRHFDRTNEPRGHAIRRSAQGSRRRFVVQKHAASHLHYDFRLEMHDVLKSWAVPKGLPLENEQRHTGFETEDHPLEYLEFEGIIPQGEYGGGTVMVWDIGTYEIVSGNYWKGQLTVFLTGKKLKGEWSLLRVESKDAKTRWLITKTGGRTLRITKKQQAASAVSAKTMEEIAGAGAAVWKPAGGSAAKRSTLNAQGSTFNSKEKTNSAGSRTNKHATAPKFVPPMKATAVKALPEGEEWIYEVKWDGYRALAIKNGEDVQLLSLKEKSLTSDFPTVVEAIRTINADIALIDGEIVAIDSRGCPSFQMLQNRGKLGRDWQIVYYAFDLLNLEGDPLLQTRLIERKARLEKVLAGSDVRYNAELSGKVETILETVKAAGLEGVVAKKPDSLYRAGTRVTSWLKLKLNKSQEFVIGGYKPEPGSFQSILIGYYDGKKLMFAGKVRQGFNPASRGRLLRQMQPFVIDRCPFANLPTSKRSHFGEGITEDEMDILCWLKPKLVAQVSFTEWTNYGLLRHATFEGLRDDKEPRAIVREI